MNPLAVVIPTKTASNIIPCAESIWQHESPQMPIVIVDDGLAPDTAQRARFTTWDRENLPIWIYGDKPFIFSRNVNKGIAKVPAHDVVVCNDDALLQSPGGFSVMQHAAEEHPEFGVIGAVTNVTGQPLQQPHGVGLREVPHFAFVCVLIPRRTINLIGLLDERYCLDYGVEDLDYCEAAKRAGLKVGVFDHCYVDHGSLVSTFRGNPHTPKSFAKNYNLFAQKWGMK